MKMEITVVGMPDEPVYKFSTGEEMLEKSREVSWEFAGFEIQPYLVKVLHGLPKFKELCGPVADGISDHGFVKILYQTRAANEFYSS